MSMVAEVPVRPVQRGRWSRPGDDELRVVLGEWAARWQSMVVRVVARSLRDGDRHLAEDLAQDVWVTAWQHLLGGGRVERPAGWLATVARRQVRAHYRSARARREVATDFEDAVTVARLAAWIGAGS